MTSIRIWAKLRRINRALIRRNVPYRQRRAILVDLRRNVHDAAAQVGAAQALERLGDPDDLAAQYSDDDHRRRPLIRNGVIWTAWTIILLGFVTLVRIPTFGTIDEFDRHTGATTWHVQLWRLGEAGGDTSTDTLFEATVYNYADVLLAAAAFIVASRLWRAIRHDAGVRGSPAAAR
jgi:HAAS